jgi:hypothetical protein
MKTREFQQSLGRGIAALALSATFALGAGAASAAGDAQTIVVAQTTVATPAAVVVVRTYPDYMKRAVAASAQGPEALRRYLWRTRMIYNFYYPDFVPNT